MKRDMELIKIILLNIENDEANNKIEDYEEEEIMYNKFLLNEAGYIDAIIATYTEGASSRLAKVHVKNLTWKGHELLDVLKDDNKFNLIKDLGKNLSLEALRMAIKEAISSAL